MGFCHSGLSGIPVPFLSGGYIVPRYFYLYTCLPGLRQTNPSFMKRLLIILMPLALASCYVNESVPIAEDMDKWIGKTEQDVKLEYGAPASVTDDGGKGKILHYQLGSVRRGVSISNPNYRNSYSSSKETDVYADYFINTDGKVYHWITNQPERTRKVKVKDSQAYKAQLAKNKKH